MNMSDIKYSIDDILREAARIKEGGAFSYQQETQHSTKPAPPAPQPSSTKKAVTPDPAAAPNIPARLEQDAAPRPKRIIRAKPAATRRPNQQQGAVPTASASPVAVTAHQSDLPLARTQKAPDRVPPPANYPSEDYAQRIARETFGTNVHNKTQEIPLPPGMQRNTPPVKSIISPTQAPAPGPKHTVPVYIPPDPEPVPPRNSAALLSDTDLLAEIHSKKSQYKDTRGRVEPRADYTPRHIVAPRFNTPDANTSEATQIIDTEGLRQITPVPSRDPAGTVPINQRTAKTQVIDPRALNRARPDFRFIKDVGTVKTANSEPIRTDALPAIESRRDYAGDFQQPNSPAQPTAPVQAAARQPHRPPPAHRPGDNRFIKGSVIHKSEKTDEILFTKNPPPIIERPAVIRGETKFHKTADLQEIPEIMSVEDFKTKAVHTAAPLPRVEEYDYSANQIRLDGFESETENLDKIDENLAEAQLYERRKEKVGHFKLFGLQQEEGGDEKEEPDYFEFGEEDDTSLEPINDYNSPRDRDSILESLAAKTHKLSVRTMATGVITVIMLFFAVLEAMNLVPAMLSDTYTMLTLLSAMTCIVLFFNLNTLGNGLRGLFRFQPDADFPITAATVFVGVQVVYAYLSPDLIAEGLPVYPMALAFGFLCNNIGKQALLRRVHVNFEFLISNGLKYTVQDIEDQKDTQSMCQGLLMGDPVVKHSVITEFPTNFLEIAYKKEPADVLSKKIAPFTILISIAIGAAAYIMNQNLSLAISASACAACISVPVISLLASNTALLSMSKKIKANGAMVNGFHGAQQAEDANAIVFDAADLFPAGSCDLHGIKTFGGMRVDDAILQTAAVIINAKGPLQDVFDKVIVGKQSILPEVDSLVYEERMGISGWIYGKKILVGNRQLLINHGVKVPPEEFEAKYKHDDRYLLYLTVAGKIAAMFVVSYKANHRVKQELIRLEKSGMTVLVRTSDPNISEEMLTRQYDLDEGFVRVLSSVSGRIYEKYSAHSVETYPAYIIHNGTANGFISAMYASDVLGGIKNMLNIVQAFGAVLGLGLASVFALFGGLSQMGPLTVVLYQSIWGLLVLALSKYKK